MVTRYIGAIIKKTILCYFVSLLGPSSPTHSHCVEQFMLDQFHYSRSVRSHSLKTFEDNQAKLQNECISVFQPTDLSDGSATRQAEMKSLAASDIFSGNDICER